MTRPVFWTEPLRRDQSDDLMASSDGISQGLSLGIGPSANGWISGRCEPGDHGGPEPGALRDPRQARFRHGAGRQQPMVDRDPAAHQAGPSHHPHARSRPARPQPSGAAGRQACHERRLVASPDQQPRAAARGADLSQALGCRVPVRRC